MFHRRPTDQDIERLLTGRSPEDETLARMLPLVDALRRVGERAPSEAETRRVAAQAARLAGSALEKSPASAHPTAGGAQRRTPRVLPRLAPALVLILLLCSMTGVAFAADSAAPGDALYGLDRAAEKIGIGSGGLAERLTEASTLADRGQIEEGVTHAAEALGGSGGQNAYAEEAQAALLAAVNAVRTAAAAEAGQLRAQVAEMLRWMATTEANGEDLTQGIATRARAIAGGNETTKPTHPATVDPTGAGSGTYQQGSSASTLTTDDATTATSQQGSTTGTTTGQPMTTTSTAASQSVSSSTQGAPNGPPITGPSTSYRGAGQP